MELALHSQPLEIYAGKAVALRQRMLGKSKAVGNRGKGFVGDAAVSKLHREQITDDLEGKHSGYFETMRLQSRTYPWV